MPAVFRLVLTVVFGFAWMWVYDYAEGVTILVWLASILTLCVCCCKGDPSGEWSWQRYIACFRRCWPNLAILVVGIVLAWVLWQVVNGGGVPAGPQLVQAFLGVLGAVVAVRLICCAYE